MQLVWPTPAHLPSYVAALQTGWSADNVRGAIAAAEELATIEADAEALINGMIDREAQGDPVTLPDGSKVKRIPGLCRCRRSTAVRRVFATASCCHELPSCARQWALRRQ